MTHVVAVHLLKRWRWAPPQDIAFHPHFEGKIAGAHVERAGIGHRDGVVHAVEGQGLPIGGLARHPRRPVHQRPVWPLPEVSASVVPLPSFIPYTNTGALGGRITGTVIDVVPVSPELSVAVSRNS